LPCGRTAVGQVFADDKERKAVNVVAAPPTFAGLSCKLQNYRNWFKLMVFDEITSGRRSRAAGAEFGVLPLALWEA
jgi:hypothetical protein